MVRDKIPEIIEHDGEKPLIRILGDEEYIFELFRKLSEEVEEAICAKADDGELIKEIGDVYEVIDAIVESRGLDKEEIMKLKKKRLRERGGFKEKVFLISSE